MFKSNEYLVSMPNPVKNPNVIALQLTKKSKRNLLIKHGLLPLALVVVLPYVTAFVDGLLSVDETNPNENSENPEES